LRPEIRQKQLHFTWLRSLHILIQRLLTQRLSLGGNGLLSDDRADFSARTRPGFQDPDKNRSGWIVFLGFVAAALPLLIVTFPPVLDYPNHLARLWLLAGGADHPPLSSTYIVDWSHASTNVGVDWAAAELGRLLPISVVDRVIRTLMFLSAPAGAVFLSRAVWGKWTPWQLAPIAVAWSATTIAGFMSYSIALGAALFCATFIQKRGIRLDPLTLTIHVLLSCALLLLHPFGLFFYLVIISALVLGPDSVWPVTRAYALQKITKIGVFTLLSTLPVAVLFLVSSHPPGTSTILTGSLADHLSPKTIVRTLLSPILTYKVSADVLLTLPIAIMGLAAAVTGRLRVHFGLALVGLVLALLSLAMPDTIGDASWMNRRLPLMAALSVLVAVSPRPLTVRWQQVMLAMLVLTTLGRVTWISYIWHMRDSDVEDLYAVAGQVKPGDAVLVVKQVPRDIHEAPIGRYLVGAPLGWDSTRRHLPNLLTISNGAFIPTLFTVPGQHPIRISGPREIDSVRSSTIPPLNALSNGSREDPYVSRWRCDFQFVLLVGADEPANDSFVSAGLTKIASRGFATLYAIKQKTGPAALCGPPVP
jgi:hypothetical protein